MRGKTSPYRGRDVDQHLSNRVVPKVVDDDHRTRSARGQDGVQNWLSPRGVRAVDENQISVSERLREARQTPVGREAAETPSREAQRHVAQVDTRSLEGGQPALDVVDPDPIMLDGDEARIVDGGPGCEELRRSSAAELDDGTRVVTIQELLQQPEGVGLESAGIRERLRGASAIFSGPD
jgi:hypothetical protein